MDDLRAEQQTLLEICDRLKEQYLKTEEERKTCEANAVEALVARDKAQADYKILQERLDKLIDRNQALEEAMEKQTAALAPTGQGKTLEYMAQTKTQLLEVQRKLKESETEVLALRQANGELKDALELEQATTEELGQEADAMKEVRLFSLDLTLSLLFLSICLSKC